jgi:hypothetical protein
MKEQPVRQLYRILLVAGIACGSGGTALAYDSAGELAVGGLRFPSTGDLAMDSEEVRISLQRVSVRYQLSNASDNPVTLSLTFPLPDIDLSEPDNLTLPSRDPVNFIDFETRVDGQPAKFSINQRAYIGDKDVTAVLGKLKFPVLPVGAHEVRIADLPAPTRDGLVSSGLLVPVGTSDNGRPLYTFGWIVKTSAVRRQLFPAGHRVTIELQYRPGAGRAIDTVLRKSLRQSKGLAPEIGRYRSDYCVTDAFLADIDRLAASGARKSLIQERRISYLLNAGANWPGPIRNFKLVVEPGIGDPLVSFCPGALKRSGPQPLELTATNFKPDNDLKILMVGRF